MHGHVARSLLTEFAALRMGAPQLATRPAFINLSLDDSALCLLGYSNQRQLISHMCVQPVGNPRRRPPRIIDGTRER
jgi:hypothetical protein